MYSILKSISDFSLGIILLILFSWLLLLIVVLLYLHTNKPLFSQLRIGYRDQPFVFFKFRTLDDLSGRPTRLGAFLRRWSLDELPQLINVIKGEMSFIGPRPLLPEYLELYSENQKKRHLVKPGITGWAQVKGRNKLTWTEQFDLDVWYVDNRGFLLDMKIIGLTFLNFLRSSDGETQMREAFNGKN